MTKDEEDLVRQADMFASELVMLYEDAMNMLGPSTTPDIQAFDIRFADIRSRRMKWKASVRHILHPDPPIEPAVVDATVKALTECFFANGDVRRDYAEIVARAVLKAKEGT